MALFLGMCLFLLPAGSVFAAQASATSATVQSGAEEDAAAAQEAEEDAAAAQEAEDDKDAAGKEDAAKSKDTEEDKTEADEEDAASQDEDKTGTEKSGTDEEDSSETGSKLARTRSLLGSPSRILKVGANQYAIGSSSFPRVSITASYNGTNIIINFDFKLGSNDNIHRVYMGWTGELYCADAKKPNGGSAPENTTSNFGTVTYTNITSFWYGAVDVTGYITITDPAGLANWYNSSNHVFWYTTYQNTGGTDDPRYCSDMSPMNISGLSTAITQAQCEHNYVYEATGAAEHRCYCTKCGHQVGTSAHVFNLVDTSSEPGYTITSCSLCGYTAAKTANTYTVTLDSTDAATPGTGSISVVFQSDMPAITLPTKPGYEFRGYYSGENGTGTQYYTESGASAHVYDLAQDTTLYAYWYRYCETCITDPVENEFTFAGV